MCVSVKVNGVAAPLYYVSPGQINFQVPWATPTTGTVNVAVLVNGGSSNIAAVPVATAAPGLFYDPVSGAAIVQNTPDYTLNDPFESGAGRQHDRRLPDRFRPGVARGQGRRPHAERHADVGDIRVYGEDRLLAATVSFAGLTPGFIGLVQMNIVVPSTLTPGVYPLSVTIDGQTSNSATIAVK